MMSPLKTRSGAVLAGALLALACASSAAPASGPEASAVGLWSYRTAYPTGLRGELVITHQGARWHAALGKARADATASGPEVRLVFPGEGGVFRGRLEHGVLRGFWIRRGVTEDP